MPIKLLATLGLILVVPACNTQGDLTRGAIGAGVGCAVGELVDGKCVEGAVIGGVGGVVANDIGL